MVKQNHILALSELSALASTVPSKVQHSECMWEGSDCSSTCSLCVCFLKPDNAVSGFLLLSCQSQKRFLLNFPLSAFLKLCFYNWRLSECCPLVDELDVFQLQHVPYIFLKFVCTLLCYKLNQINKYLLFSRVLYAMLRVGLCKNLASVQKLPQAWTLLPFHVWLKTS